MRMLSDSEKLEILFDLYEKKMYGTAFQILRDVGQAEDAVQDAFIRVMSHLNQIKSPESPETKHFMIKVIRSAAIDIYRKNQREWEKVFYDPEDVFKNQKMSNDRGMDTVEDPGSDSESTFGAGCQVQRSVGIKMLFWFKPQRNRHASGNFGGYSGKRYERAKKIAIKMIGDGVCA